MEYFFTFEVQMTRLFYIMLITMIGFFSIPTLSYACEKSEIEKSCCDEEASQKDCCKEKHSQNNDNCGGNCKHSSCHCATVCVATILPFTLEPKCNAVIGVQKQSFLYTNPSISSGFHSIWQPPKIG